jgi:hypothetical protein
MAGGRKPASGADRQQRPEQKPEQDALRDGALVSQAYKLPNKPHLRLLQQETSPRVLRPTIS